MSKLPGSPPRLVLASASPARRRLLEAAGIDAEVQVSGVDESTVDASRADTLCLALARLKADAVAQRRQTDDLVLGCDSVLEFDGRILGKPADHGEAIERWLSMCGRSGVLYTGHCLIAPGSGPGGGTHAEGVAKTTVHFATPTDDEIAAYVASGEPLHVAGAFTIDGLGGPFVEWIEGDHSNVIGLSLPLLRQLLAELGIPITCLWRKQLASGT